MQKLIQKLPAQAKVAKTVLSISFIIYSNHLKSLGETLRILSECQKYLEILQVTSTHWWVGWPLDCQWSIWRPGAANVAPQPRAAPRLQPGARIRRHFLHEFEWSNWIELSKNISTVSISKSTINVVHMHTLQICSCAIASTNAIHGRPVHVLLFLVVPLCSFN